MLTIWQFLSLLTFGFVGLLTFLHLIFAVRFKDQPFPPTHAWVFAVCVIELLVAFLGVK